MYISSNALFKICLLSSKFSNVYKILKLIREQLFTLQKEPETSLKQQTMLLIKVLLNNFFVAYNKGYLS